MPRRRFLALCTAASAFQLAPRPRRLTARHSLPDFLLAAGDSATVVESVGPEVYGKIFGGGVGLFVVGVGGAAITALLIDSTDAYERLAEDFGAEGMKGLEEEFGADAARAVVEGVKSDTADRKIDVTAPAPKEEPLFELPSLPSLPNPFGGGGEAAPAAAPVEDDDDYDD